MERSVFAVRGGTYARLATESPSKRNGLKVAGIILYGLAAGIAMAAVIFLGPVSLGFLASWLFERAGWQQASASAARFTFFCFYINAVVGPLAGIVVWCRVCITRLRNAPGKLSSNVHQ